MATALQIAANRRNAKRSTGPKTPQGRAAVRLNAVQHGMTAKVIVLPHESEPDYHEIRAALIQDYAPANSQEFMLVDQIAAGYWRTIRARRFEQAMFDNQLRTKKQAHRRNTRPGSKDDEGCAVVLQVTRPESLHNYFRYDGSISRDYYRAITALERMQASRRREDARQQREAEAHAREFARVLKHPDPDTIAPLSPEPPDPCQPSVDMHVNSIGSVSHFSQETMSQQTMSQERMCGNREGAATPTLHADSSFSNVEPCIRHLSPAGGAQRVGQPTTA